jgi:hypothetical protein
MQCTEAIANSATTEFLGHFGWGCVLTGMTLFETAMVIFIYCSFMAVSSLNYYYFRKVPHVTILLAWTHRKDDVSLKINIILTLTSWKSHEAMVSTQMVAGADCPSTSTTPNLAANSPVISNFLKCISNGII